MASGELEKVPRQDWILANPWFWTFLGLGLCLVAWMLVLALGEELSGPRVLIVFLGLMAAGTGVALRLNSSAPSHLGQMAPGFRSLVLLGLTLLFALIAVTTTVLLLLRICGVDAIQWRLNALVILWLIVGPMSLAAMVYCAKRVKPDNAIQPAEESAALLALASLTVFCALWALYNRDQPDDWDSMRLFLSGVFLVAMVATPLVLVSQALRRLVVSLLVVLHFIGISTAALSPPPSPWIIQQAWARIYQPYLEFMYLNNAYHFYAPEPGAASYLWFRMFYKNSEGELFGHWVKIPDMDDNGNPKNTVALEYQRMLSITENTVSTDPIPSSTTTLADGTNIYAEWYARRLEHSPNQQGKLGEPALGKDALIVPFPPIPLTQQYLPPNGYSRAILSSYARHVCLAPHPEHPDWKIDSVKIYRVIHVIPQVFTFVHDRMDPRDPQNYAPYYMGKYDPTGALLDMPTYSAKGLEKPGDPFLFWMLPMLRDNYTQLKSPIKSWVAKHAGDPDWIYQFDERARRHLLVHDHDGGAANQPNR